MVLSTLQDLKEIETIFANFQDLQKLIQQTSGNCFDRKVQKLIENYKSLFEKHCPFRDGDRVVLVREPEIDDKSGWRCCKHFLVRGAKAVVKDRDYYQDRYWFGLNFEDDSWIDLHGNTHLTEPDKRFLIRLPAEYLEIASHD